MYNNLASTATGWVSISDFASLAGIAVGGVSSTEELKICAITWGIKKYKLIINKQRKNHNKILLLVKYHKNLKFQIFNWLIYQSRWICYNK